MEDEVESGENVNYAVICGVSAFENRPPMELPPLQKTIDTDSLDSIFQTQRGEVQVSFYYGNSRVTVINTGHRRISS